MATVCTQETGHTGDWAQRDRTLGSCAVYRETEQRGVVEYRPTGQDSGLSSVTSFDRKATNSHFD